MEWYPSTMLRDIETSLGQFESSSYAVDPKLFWRFARSEWAGLSQKQHPVPSEEILSLVSPYQPMTLEEISTAYLPLSSFLTDLRSLTQALRQTRATLLGRPQVDRPFVIGIAGSVAVGKSTFARILKALMQESSPQLRVEIVTTDGFLFPNRILAERDLMKKKGFPQSYDLNQMVQFLEALTSGQENIHTPVYSHLAYDITGDLWTIEGKVDVLLFEGLNVLQMTSQSVVISDFFDFSIYVDADEDAIKTWFIHRFLRLRTDAFRNPGSYFNRYQSLSEIEALEFASNIWEEINAVNLRENIRPTRSRADLIFHKSKDHTLNQVLVRR